MGRLSFLICRVRGLEWERHGFCFLSFSTMTLIHQQHSWPQPPSTKPFLLWPAWEYDSYSCVCVCFSPGPASGTFHPSCSSADICFHLSVCCFAAEQSRAQARDTMASAVSGLRPNPRLSTSTSLHPHLSPLDSQLASQIIRIPRLKEEVNTAGLESPSPGRVPPLPFSAHLQRLQGGIECPLHT